MRFVNASDEDTVSVKCLSDGSFETVADACTPEPEVCPHPPPRPADGPWEGALTLISGGREAKRGSSCQMKRNSKISFPKNV